MKLMSIVAALAVFASSVRADEVKYPLTGENSKVAWVGSKPGGKHQGGFKKLKGTATVADDGTVDLAVDIDCNSLFSDAPKLTGHLKSADFFDVKAHPKSTFKTTKVEKEDKGYTVTGDLTLLGKTKEISFPAEINTDGKFTLKANFKINRSDFGMNYKPGEIDDAVSLQLNVNAKPTKSAQK